MVTYTAVPSGARALELRNSLNITLRNGLAAHFAATRRMFPGASENAARILDGFPTNESVASIVYTLHWMLASAVRAQDVGRVHVALARLSQLDTVEPPSPGLLTVSTLKWDDLDRELMLFLAGPEGPRTRDGLIPEIRGLVGHEYDRARRWVDAALPKLAELDSELFGEFTSLVQEIRLFDGRGARGITSTRCYGTILLRIPTSDQELTSPFLYFLDHLTHELSHLVLHGFMNHDPLILNGHAERFAAPMRPDPRPLYGIYHAAFVLARIIRVLARYEEEEPAAGPMRRDYEEKFELGRSTIMAKGHLTPSGLQMLDSCAALVETATA